MVPALQRCTIISVHVKCPGPAITSSSSSVLTVDIVWWSYGLELFTRRWPSPPHLHVTASTCHPCSPPPFTYFIYVSYYCVYITYLPLMHSSSFPCIFHRRPASPRHFSQSTSSSRGHGPIRHPSVWFTLMCLWIFAGVRCWRAIIIWDLHHRGRVNFKELVNRCWMMKQRSEEILLTRLLFNEAGLEFIKPFGAIQKVASGRWRHLFHSIRISVKDREMQRLALKIWDFNSKLEGREYYAQSQAISRFHGSRFFPFSKGQNIRIFYYLCLVYKEIFILSIYFWR